MAEYGREQRGKLSRVIVNKRSGNNQLKGLVDNRKSTDLRQKKTFDLSRKAVTQFAFTAAGNSAKTRVSNITGESFRFDPYGGVTFIEWHPPLSRIGFNPLIRNHVIAAAPHDAGNPSWITCRYCNYEYPESRIQADHITNWADYSLTMTTSPDLGDARALEVYIGCNDPRNLVACCNSCNASKGDRTATQGWIDQRIALAQQKGGF